MLLYIDFCSIYFEFVRSCDMILLFRLHLNFVICTNKNSHFHWEYFTIRRNLMISSFDIAKLHSLLEDFYQLTKIRITVFDDAFHELTAYPDRIPSFCRLIRKSPEGAARCQACDQHACETAATNNAAYTYQCHAGLTECIAPIRMGNIVIGYLFFGHVFSYSTYEEGWENVQTRCRDYGLPMSKLKTACYKRPIITEDYITSASHIMKAVASFLCMDRMVSLRRQELPVQIDAYIQSHYSSHMNVLSLAKHFHIGKTKIYEISKQNYGMGIAEYIRKLRIEKAKQLLLEESDLSLAEIGFKCGFNDYNYFITVFKRVVGLPPKKYLLQHSLE